MTRANGSSKLQKSILITFNTSKSLILLTDFKYLIFVKFKVKHQKLRVWQNLPDFQKRGNPPKTASGIDEIRPSGSAYQRNLMQRFQAHILWYFAFLFLRREITCLLVCLFVFFLKRVACPNDSEDGSFEQIKCFRALFN